MKMNEKVKKLWVDALRSGDYKQGEGQLRDSFVNEFCCLGVLCNIHAQTFPSVAKRNTVEDVYEGMTDIPSDNVLRWAGLDVGKYVTIKGLADTLYGHNDSGQTFKQIAKAIEEQL